MRPTETPPEHQGRGPRLVVIINPVSGAGWKRDEARRRAELAASLLDERRLDADVFVTERQGHARELALAALRRGATRFVAWGGDGTVNEVASAIVYSPASLAIVPSGSGNGLARELGVPFDVRAAFLLAFGGRARLMDAGEIEGRLFFNVAGLGLDARVAHRFASSGRTRRGFARYLELTARELFTFEPDEQIVAADAVTMRARPLVIAIANARQYGNGAVIAPHARIDDGKLDVVIVNHRSPWAVLRQARNLFSGSLASVPGVSMTQAAAVEVSSAASLMCHVDGEPLAAGCCVRARIRPAALRVVTADR